MMGQSLKDIMLFRLINRIMTIAIRALIHFRPIEAIALTLSLNALEMVESGLEKLSLIGIKVDMNRAIENFWAKGFM